MGNPSDRRGWALFPIVAVLATAALTSGAAAQVTSAQQNAIRQSCRSDFMAKCSGVTPGGKDALACLQKNVESLSPSCKSAVSATLPPPAPAAAAPTAPAPTTPAPTATQTPPAPPPAAAQAAPHAQTAPPTAAQMPAKPTAAQQNALRQSCRSDFMAKCSGVTPGGKEALACLQQNAATLSPACKTAVRAISGSAPAAARPSAPPRPASAAMAPPAAAPAQPNAAQQSAIRSACRSDFMSQCSGVTPGGRDALVCLQKNAAALSPACQKAVSAVGAPAGAAVAVAPPAPAPREPRAPLVNAAMMLRACKLDLIRHCQGVNPGGGRELACLAAHDADLTFRCRTAMKVTAPLR